MKLAELQEIFWSMTAGAQGVRARGDAGDVFVDGPRLNAASRIGIYADMFLWRQLDCLREDFPKLASLLGDAGFEALTTAYLAEHPSQHHSLSKLGRHLPHFLSSRRAQRPDLSDLAQLEWARAEVFDETDAASLASPESLDRPIAFIPALRVLRLEHDVLRVWAAIEDGLPPPQPRRVPMTLIVWRKTFEIFHVRVSEPEAAALERARAGEALSTACEAFGSLPDAVATAFRALSSWFAEGWVARTTRTIKEELP